MKFKRSLQIICVLSTLMIITICFTGCACQLSDEEIEILPLEYEVRDYEQTVIVEISHWNSVGCEGVIVDACSHDVLEKGDTIFAELERGNSKIYYKDGTEFQYNKEGVAASECDIVAGSKIEVKFKALAYKNVDKERIYVEEIREIEE